MFRTRNSSSCSSNSGLSVHSANSSSTTASPDPSPLFSQLPSSMLQVALQTSSIPTQFEQGKWNVGDRCLIESYGQMCSGFVSELTDSGGALVQLDAGGSTTVSLNALVKEMPGKK